MARYYRVLEDNFLWKKGAIISDRKTVNHFYPIQEDVWDHVPCGNEYISGGIINHPDNAIFFERVYPDTVSGKFFQTKDQVIQAYEKAFK